MAANQTGDENSPFEILSEADAVTRWVAIPKGRFNLHVWGGEGSWVAQVSYKGGAPGSEIDLDKYYESKKLTPYEGDSFVTGSVLYRVKALEATAPWNVRIAS
ncbi:MAG: hypothetical protein KQI62_02285 [Deltaproteobacteria bacterium]|nr:hypothetical protein [Deltaproteobacteria bacterium]